MNTKLEIVKTKGQVAFFDDDRPAAEAMALSLEALTTFETTTFTSLEDATLRLKKSNDVLVNEEARLTEICSNESSTFILKSVYEMLANRKPVIEVFFCDYDMGYANGVDLLGSIENCLIRRVIITGVADNEVAVSAFNKNMIDVFIKKNTAAKNQTIADIARQGAKRESRNSNSEISQMLNNIALSTAIRAHFKSLDIENWIVLERPMGIMSKSASGIVRWHHIETEKSLPDTLDFLEAEGAKSMCREVSNGEIGVCPELSNAFPGKFPPLPKTQMKEIFEEPWLIMGEYEIGA